MKLHELSPAPGSKFNSKRVGRGHGSGFGKTSGKGQKGQKARSGGKVRVGFEGGQMPLMRRIPKRGFTNVFKKEYNLVNLSDLNKFAEGTVVTIDLLQKEGMLKKLAPYGLKVLGNGKLDKALTVKANKFSESATAKITKAGGKVEVL